MNSGIDVLAAMRPESSSMTKAEAAGITVVPDAQAAEEADVIMILLPDTEQKRVYEADIQQHMTPGKALAFVHGFNVRFDRIAPPKGVGVIMIAPKGPGHLVRRTYTEGGGVPCLIAIAQNATGK